MNKYQLANVQLERLQHLLEEGLLCEIQYQEETTKIFYMLVHTTEDATHTDLVGEQDYDGRVAAGETPDESLR